MVALLVPGQAPLLEPAADLMITILPSRFRARILATGTVLSLSFSAAVAQVDGTVVDAATSKPIAGAIVTLQTTKLRATAAGNGTYRLVGVPRGQAIIVAAKKGYYNAPITIQAPASKVRIAMEAVPLVHDKNYQFVDPKHCGGCHFDQIRQWTGSPMAKTGTNSWVYDIYNGTGTSGGKGGFVYTRDSIHASKHPAAECASCHQPEPWIKNFGQALDPINNQSVGALHGVSCEICHKISNIDMTKPNYPGIWPGVVDVTLPILKPPFIHQVQYGVLGDSSFAQPFDMRGSYQPQLTAEMCASCHQDKNDPDGNGKFEEPNGVISEPTYLEWAASAYGDPKSKKYQTCVDCHMPAYGADQVCIYPPPGKRDKKTIRSHSIEGTTPVYLENAVTMKMNVVPRAGNLRVSVGITNDFAGHHVPTGVTIRNMILLVEAWEVANGKRLQHRGQETIHPLGGVGDPSQGYYASLPGKLYAKVSHDAKGSAPVFYTEAAGIRFDTRIPALATDSTSYDFAIPKSAGTLRVRARLIYRRSFRAVVDAKKWTKDGHGRPLADIAPPIFGHLMEENMWTGTGPGDVSVFGKACGTLKAGTEGSPYSGSRNFALTLAGAPKNSAAQLLVGVSNTKYLGLKLPFALSALGGGKCFLLVSPDILLATGTDAKGMARFSIPLPHPAPIGVTAYAQWATVSSANRLGVELSDGVRFTIQR